MKYIRQVALFLLAMLVGCSSLSGASAGTPTLVSSDTPLPTASLTPTLEPTASFTETPFYTPTIMPTIEPMIAIAIAPVTFRSEPRKGSDNVGGVFTNEAVKVIARNEQATWFYIIAPEAPGGMAWALASAFTLQGDITRLPIATFPDGSQTPVLLPPIIYEITGTPLPLNTPGPGAQIAKVTLLAKVRVGPGLGYMAIGLLEPGTVVVVTGRIKGNGWLQIEYPSGLDGRGWILGELVKFEGEYAGLPFFNLLGTNIPKDEPAPEQSVTDTPSALLTPADTPVPPTPTVDKPFGITLAQINARSGPASSYPAYGLIDKDQRVNLLGQTLNGLWLLIEYPSAPSGVAWVAAQYVKVMSDIKGLPYYDDKGNPIQKP